MRPIALSVLVIAVIDFCGADVYMHNPRGSNNRLNEPTATRTNNNRMFDSQNNARGGYNVGDKTDKAAGLQQENQYRMKYFQSGKYMTRTRPAATSELVISWTNQHGCGSNDVTDPHNPNCNIVIQALCQDETGNFAANDGISLRDGFDTTTQGYIKVGVNSAKATFDNRRNLDTSNTRGLQEPWYWYDDCSRRQRNKGLFTADQQLTNEDATSTRQNPKGGRSGYECPEERDYFPYWHPTPFIDIAVLAQDESLCSTYAENSANRVAKYRCIEYFNKPTQPKHFSVHNNQADCENNGGDWTAFYGMLELATTYTNIAACESDHGDGMTYKWGKPYDPDKIDKHEQIIDVCFVLPPPIDCQAAPWSRPNHLGNGRDLTTLNYTWILPYFPSELKKRCSLRLRYNISTDDYDPFNTDSSSNKNTNVIANNPLVDVGAADNRKLQLALNTAQTGRTFQDRSHVFILYPRPTTFAPDAHIINLNVQGKRGNIVQTFPAVEYDFVPNRLEGIRRDDDYIHVQWTGSNTHNNNGDGGDGQAGDDGQGTGGTDRHNFLELRHPDNNFPVPYGARSMFQNAEIMWSYNGNVARTAGNIELILATAGYYGCMNNECGADSVNTKAALNSELDNAAASFEGVVLKYTKRGKHYFMCTRNNNFSNRSQKGHIFVI